MKILTLLILAFACTGCAARASMGEPFQHEAETLVAPDQGRVILFHAASQPDVQFHRIRVDDGRRERLVVGGYLSYDLPPGQHTINASRRMTAGIIFAGMLLAADELLDDHTNNDTTIHIEPGQIVYLEVSNAAGDRRYECHASKDEARICTDTSVRPQFEHVDATYALANLSSLTEIEK